jgi:hypothetical protein
VTDSHDGALARLEDISRELREMTGGVPAAMVIAEHARRMAGELATYFDAVPSREFSGRVPRRGGVLGFLLPARGIPHRVVLGRYLSSSPPRQTGPGLVRTLAALAVLGLGRDGELRVGRLYEMVVLPAKFDLPDAGLPWNDERVRGVPSRPIRLSRWSGTAEPAQVAGPAVVLDALSALAADVRAASASDLALLRRLHVRRSE